MWGWQESNQAATEHLHREASLCLPPTIQWWEDSCPRAPETSNTNQQRTREKKILIPKVGLPWSVKLVPSRALGEKTQQVSFQLPMASNHWPSLTCGYFPISPFSDMTPPLQLELFFLFTYWRQSPSYSANQHLSKIRCRPYSQTCSYSQAAETGTWMHIWGEPV